MNKTSQNPEAILGQMGSLADPTRLRLLRLLEQNELGVVELCEVLQLKQSTVSNHLKVLLDQKWLSNRRIGTTNKYRMILDEIDPPARKLWLIAREQTDEWATAEQDRLRLQRVLSDRPTDSREFFAGAAGQWDKLRVDLYGESFVSDLYLSLLSSDLSVVDLGCGTGKFTADLSPHVKKVVGVDNSPAMLKAAQERVEDLGNVELVRADLESLPLESNTFDAAMLTLVLTYIETPAPVVNEAIRILKPGGRLVVIDLLRHDREDFRREMGQVSRGFDLQPIEALLKSGGLTDVKAKALQPAAQAKGPALFVARGVKRAG